MNIARRSIERPLPSWIIILVCLAGGVWGFLTLGRLEDPAFTIKQAVVETHYPGASAQQVAREVSEPLESAIQKLAEVERIQSINRPGVSSIEVHIDSRFAGSELPAIWTRLRARVEDAARQLPSGVEAPEVNDSFGDVFGLYYAVTAEGFADAEKHRLATFLRRELLAVEGVADVSVRGLPEEAIFVEPNLALAVNLTVAPQIIAAALANANSVVDAGATDTALIAAPAGSDTVSEIAGLSIGVGGDRINLADLAEVSRGRQSDPDLIVRFNGIEAFTIGIAGLATENIVAVGKRVEQRLATLQRDIPIGVELHPIYRQHLVVEAASNDFLANLAMSVGIVTVVLALFMGWRAGAVVGSTLLLTVVGTLFFMMIFSIEMERISLGGLIIAMGMLVDNAIVVAEGMQTAMLQGKSSRDAADEAASRTQAPLLGATLIGIMAFAGIGLSPDATGEFLFSLFAVIGISLLLSWLLAMTVTPLLGHYLFRQGGAKTAVYDSLVFRAYGAVLRGALKIRWLVLAVLATMTAASLFGFTHVQQQFFPDSNTPIFFVHYKLPQGTRIHRVSEDLAAVEAWLSRREEVESVATFVGGGASRFVLTYSAGMPNPSYGHLIIRARSLDRIPALQTDLEAFGRLRLPEGEFRTRRPVFGPGGSDPIQVRFSGSDPDILRRLGEEAIARMATASNDLNHLRTDWRERELVISPLYASARAQTAGLAREDIAATLKFATDGLRAGAYREGERLIPIIVRLPRESGLGLGDQMVWSTAAAAFVPIEQAIDGFTWEAQDTLVHRRDRLLTLTVSADIPRERTAAEVHATIRKMIEGMLLPLGYQMAWGGEFESSGKAQSGLAGQLPLSVVAMVLISILLFNTLRQPLVVWLLVPMAVNGVVIGLLGTGLPFTFTALLGLLSLSGMLIKNGIVLVEEIDLVRRNGRALNEAIETACKSRLRPVALAAATTILGMMPLLTDAFFVSMAATIMSGLAFASLLTLVAAPVLYHVLFARKGRHHATRTGTDLTPEDGGRRL
ncbi:MAG: efflux RND transporter permease subunit [Alphaproteobacteria bacterium]|nr:efflux RND transporter permease subunit [Alphaproteobacteria bacterium]